MSSNYFLLAYLVLYYLLLAGAAITLWRSDMAARLPAMWTLLAFVAAAALGGLLAVVSRK